jgi:hypothetical protein
MMTSSFNVSRLSIHHIGVTNKKLKECHFEAPSSSVTSIPNVEEIGPVILDLCAYG